VTVLTGSNF